MSRNDFAFAKGKMTACLWVAAVCMLLSSSALAGMCLSNEYVRVVFDDAGCVSSIRETVSGREADGGFGRAEVTLFREGRDEPAFVKLTDEQRKLMRVEYEMPVMMNPAKGLAGDVDVRVRPGERANVRFEILGPVVNPSVAGRKMSVTLRDKFDRVASYDGRTWQAIRITPGKCGPDNRTAPAKREVIAEGTLETPLPVLDSGTTRFAVTADKAEGARVTFFKEYCVE